MASGVPALGVCLGAQLLALATGGEVLRGEAAPEIGWGPVTLGPDAADDLLLGRLRPSFSVLHWHRDTFRPGPTGVLLAASRRYPAQVLRVGTKAWGLQCHLEVDEAQVRRFASAFAHEAAQAEGGAAALVSEAGRAAAALEPVAQTVATRFARLVGETTRLPRLRAPDVL